MLFFSTSTLWGLAEPPTILVALRQLQLANQHSFNSGSLAPLLSFSAPFLVAFDHYSTFITPTFASGFWFLGTRARSRPLISTTTFFTAQSFGGGLLGKGNYIVPDVLYLYNPFPGPQGGSWFTNFRFRPPYDLYANCLFPSIRSLHQLSLRDAGAAVFSRQLFDRVRDSWQDPGSPFYFAFFSLYSRAASHSFSALRTPSILLTLGRESVHPRSRLQLTFLCQVGSWLFHTHFTTLLNRSGHDLYFGFDHISVFDTTPHSFELCGLGTASHHLC